MPNYERWLDREDMSISAVRRAADAWNRIQDKPVSLVLRRDGALLAAQTVRIEMVAGGGEQFMPNPQQGAQGVQIIAVFGVQNHVFIANTNMRRGDGFVYGNKEYVIEEILLVPGQIQAFGKARS